MYQLLAVCPMGLESIVAKEVQELGYETRIENGRIYFEGDESAIVKANLWLRTADRVKLIVGQFEAVTFDELFEKQRLCLGKQSLVKMENFLCKVVV